MKHVLSLCILALVCWVSTVESHNEDEECPEEVDILFVVDASSHITEDDYDHLREELSEFVSEGVEGLDTRYAFLQYGTYISEIANFDYPWEITSVPLDLLHYDGQQSFTHVALNQAAGHFDVSRGGRPNSMKYIVVLFDGNPTDSVATKTAADNLKSAGFTLVGFGVGTDVNMAGVEKVASENYVFDGSNLDDMEDHKESFFRMVQRRYVQLCEPCVEEVDILVILDSSSSTTETVYDILKVKVSEFVELPFGGLDMDFAYMQFTEDPKDIMLFRDTFPRVPTAKDWFYFEGGQSYSHRALKKAASFFNDGRPQAHKYVLFFSDGVHQNAHAAQTEANKLMEEGITVVGVGVGPALNVTGLGQVSSAGHVYDVSDLTTLDSTFEDVEAKVVAKVNENCEDPCTEKADVLLMIDNSGSIPEDEFDWLKVKLEDFVNQDFNNLDMDYAILQFTTSVQDILYFDDTLPPGEIIHDWLYYEGHQSYSHVSLAAAQLFLDNARPDSNKYILYVSDGEHEDEAAAVLAADSLKGNGVTIFGVGITADADMDGINLVASPDLSYDGSNMNDLDTINVQIKEALEEAAGTDC